MYILGIDFGTKKLGLALLESTTQICSPLPLLQNDKEMWEKLQKVISEYRVTHIVLGLPSYEETAKKVERFKKILLNKFAVKVDYSPEDLTSLTVKKQLTSKKQKQNLDSYSAVAILEQWAGSNIN